MIIAEENAPMNALDSSFAETEFLKHLIGYQFDTENFY